MRKALLAVLPVLLAALSCREPLSSERFVRGEGPFTFPVDMTDTAAAYDFDFYTRVDARPDEIVRLGEVPVVVRWHSPADSLYDETVYLPLQGRTSFFTRDVRAAYRADVRPYEAGLWTVTVSLPDTVSVPGLRGLGLVVTKRR